tara:strand:- start:509 stop:676 length:168 start_codon:yes stop_codon:yes gene_type:complete
VEANLVDGTLDPGDMVAALHRLRDLSFWDVQEEHGHLVEVNSADLKEVLSRDVIE